VGAEGEAPKDDRHWQDASPEGRIKAVQEWLQGKHRGKEANQGNDLRCINHISIPTVVGLWLRYLHVRPYCHATCLLHKIHDACHTIRTHATVLHEHRFELLRCRISPGEGLKIVGFWIIKVPLL